MKARRVSTSVCRSLCSFARLHLSCCGHPSMCKRGAPTRGARGTPPPRRQAPPRAAAQWATTAGWLRSTDFAVRWQSEFPCMAMGSEQWMNGVTSLR
eukprot:709134-Alexandrium_andersonii.AAC.1